jgi:hypothetical protein
MAPVASELITRERYRRAMLGVGRRLILAVPSIAAQNRRLSAGFSREWPQAIA